MADQFDTAQKLREAMSGKVSQSTQDMGPTLGERAAKAEQKQTLGLLGQQVEAKTIQLKGQQEAQKAKVDQNQMQLQQRAVNMRQEYLNKASSIMKSFQQNQDKLNLGRYKVNIEQMGFYLRLQDKKYVDKIQAEGNKARLNSKYDMAQAQQMAVFSDERDLLASSLAFKNLLSMDQRAFQAELANMDIQTAMQLAVSQANAANTAALYQGVSQLASSALEAWGRYRSPVESKQGG